MTVEFGAILSAVLGALGLYLMLPRGRRAADGVQRPASGRRRAPDAEQGGTAGLPSSAVEHAAPGSRGKAQRAPAGGMPSGDTEPPLPSLGKGGSTGGVPQPKSVPVPIRNPARLIGALLAAAGLVVLLLLLDARVDGFWLFLVVAAVAVISAAMMVTSRNPVYSALWFGVVLLATAGLFLWLGAEFLAAATVIIYAGAIVVTFLFVVMLAQEERLAAYDRKSREPGLACILTAVLVATLSATITRAAESETASDRELAADTGGTPVPLADAHRLPSAAALAREAARQPETAAVARTAAAEDEPAENPAREPGHVAGLGASLFTEHLVSIQAAALLLLIALVGAVAIAAPARRPQAGREGTTTERR